MGNQGQTTMRAIALTAISVFALAACSPRVPDSAAASGAGAGGLPPAAAVTATPLGGSTDAEAIAADTARLLGTQPAATTLATSSAAPLAGTAPLAATTLASSAAPLAVEEGAQVDPNLSDEQNFSAVAERESIESDAERIAANRAQYQMIQPTELPPRPDGTGASIVAYALATTNAPGQQLYSRSGIAANARFESACAKYGPDDRAQEVFLDNGGPERDRYGMDPDGDGFACYWDPRPFRAARGGAPAVETTYEVVETPGQS